ncbi:MAG: hypothetical protein WCF85_12950 [Rhodospirillaceae bacterium]
MSAVPFDTLKRADRLQAGGFTAEQARTASFAFAEALSGADLVTKDYLDAKLAETKTEILRWMFAAMAAQTGLIVALVRMLGH